MTIHIPNFIVWFFAIGCGLVVLGIVASAINFYGASKGWWKIPDGDLP